MGVFLGRAAKIFEGSCGRLQDVFSLKKNVCFRMYLKQLCTFASKIVDRCHGFPPYSFKMFQVGQIHHHVSYLHILIYYHETS